MTNPPSWWHGAGFCAKAAWLVSTHRAKTFEEACSMLAKMPKPDKSRQKSVSVAQYQEMMERRGLG